MFDCPVCKKRHSVPDHYDHQDYICNNTANAPGQKIYQDIVPTNQLSRNTPNMNRHSTLIDEARPTTILGIKPSYRKDGTKINVKRAYNY